MYVTALSASYEQIKMSKEITDYRNAVDVEIDASKTDFVLDTTV